MYLLRLTYAEGKDRGVNVIVNTHHIVSIDTTVTGDSRIRLSNGNEITVKESFNLIIKLADQR